MSFIKEFIKRGYLYQCTDLEKLSQKEKIIAYVGFDATANSLHVGSLMQIMILRLLQQYGHKPIIIIGGGTTKIGDPTGKDEARKVLTDAELNVNIDGIKKSLSKFIKFGNSDDDAIILNNANWLDNLNYLQFLRNFGSHISVNRMLNLEAAKTRLEREQHLSFLEFNYMLIQAYDFWYLNENYNCSLQFGGSDQWGNIIMGIDAIKKLNGSESFGLTTPLLTTASGSKMGKSAHGAVWINEDMLSPYDYFQYWRNSDDRDVIKFANLYCEFSDLEMSKFTDVFEKNINETKKKLAFRLTELCHGMDEAEKSLETSIKLFEKGAIDDNVPTFFIDLARLEKGIMLFELFFDCAMTDSKSDARRLIRGGGARINDEIIKNENQLIDIHNMKNNYIKLSLGKKKHIIIKGC
jgi:tyrosyl-tRNA synthetase